MAELVDAPAVGRGEAAQIHQHGVAVLDESRQGWPPGIGVTEKIVDAEPPIRIPGAISLGQPALQRDVIAHEVPGQLAAQKIEELMGLDGAPAPRRDR